MISPSESGPDDDDLISSPTDITARQQQQRLQALLEAAGINTSGVDGALLSHPHVLDHLSNSVNNALSQARRAMSSVTLNDDTQTPVSDLASLSHQMHRSVPFNYSESLGSISSLSIGESSYETLRSCLRDMTEDDHNEYLNQACSNGFYELVHVLIDLDNHSPDPSDHELIRKTHTQFQNIMVSKLSLNENDRQGAKGEMTPLMEAAYNGFTDIVTLLINHGHDINKKSTTGNTALMYACCGGFEHIVHNLLCAGANTEIFNENGHTPLMEAASGGHVNCARLLVHHGAEVNCASNEFKESALTLACYKGNYDMVAFLLSAGADREHKTDEMHTSLMEASMDGHTDVARLLLDSGCNVNMPQDSFESPLTLAACGGHYDLAKLLIDRGANVEEMNDEGYTALMEAAREGHEKVVKVLIDNGADVNQQTEETQETALTLACCAGFIDVARLLIEANADIEKGCSTPLMEAAQEGYEKLVDYLIESGAQVKTVATNSDTALDLAAENGHTKICQALLAAGANLEHLSEGGRTPIMRAARQGQEETVEFLIKAGANLNQYSENNEHTVLSFACHSGHLQVVKLLLQNGANPNATLKDGSTMLIEAARGGHTAVVTLLLDYSKHPNIISRNPDYDFPLSPQPTPPQPLPPNIAHALPLDQQVSALDPTLGATPCEIVQPGHVQTLDQLATDAREAQTRLEQLERKIKDAFNGRPENDQFSQQNPREDLTMEIEQIQREKQHKQELMNQLQRVENEIHRKMQHTIEAKIDNAVMDYKDYRTGDVPASFKYDPQIPEHQDPAAYSKLDPAHDKDAISQIFQTMLGQYPTNVPGLDPSATRKEWGFTTTEFNEIMKHIQVLGPAIQKAIQRHLNPDAPPEPLKTHDEPDLHQPIIDEKPTNIKIEVRPPNNELEIDTQAKDYIEQKEVELLRQQQLQHQQQQQQQQQLDQQQQPTGQTQLIPNEMREDPVYFDNINDKTESNHDTPLTLACQGGHTELVQLLVERGADLEHRDKKGFTPLILSATGGFAEICEILLDAGAQIEAQSDRTKDTPLSLACSGGKKEVVELLLSREAKKEHRNVSDYTPLSLAASGGYIDIMKILLDAGAEINSRTASKLGISPLMLAAMNGHLEAVTLLLDRGADINAQIETNKNTALTLACFQGRSEVVATLLDRRANVEHRAKTGLTPLMEAASGGYVDVGRVLLEKGADVNAPPVPSSRDTALTIASDKGHKLFVELVLNWGAHVDTKNKKGNTPIWLSCNSGHLDVLQKLIEFNGDPTIPDARNCTPLMASFKKGHVKVVKYLVKKVTQFPSDTECYNYIRSIQDKDPELKIRCAQCVETIIAAKDRQEKEANKNAEQLLRQIEEEKRKENERKQKRQTTKAKRKANKKEQKEAEKDETPLPKVTPKKNEATPSAPETPELEQATTSTPAPPVPTTEVVTPPPAAAATPKDTPPATPSTKKKKEKKKKTTSEVSAPPTPVEENPPTDDPAVAALRSVMSTGTSKAAKDEKKTNEATQQKKSKRPIKTENSNNETQQQQQQNSDWKFVPTKKPKKLVLSSSRIARVIGRSGCNVNAIRDVTGTHIDIEKPKKGGGERTITIRGNCESTTMAHKLMEELINSDKDITELIEIHFPDKKSISSAGSVKGESKEEKNSDAEKTESKPKTPSSSIEAALAAVQQSEKILNEKNERKKKKEEEEMRKKKEMEAKAREEARKAAHNSPKPVTPVHKVTPVPQPVVQEKPLKQAKDMDEETNRKVSEYLRGLAKQDEKKRQEKTQEKPIVTAVQVTSSDTPTSPQQQSSPTIFIGARLDSDRDQAIIAPPSVTPVTAPIAPPQPVQVPITPIAQPGPICPPSRRQPSNDIFSPVVDPVVLAPTASLPPANNLPPGLSQRPVSPVVAPHKKAVSPIGPRITPGDMGVPTVNQSVPKIAPIGPPREPKPPVAVIPPIQNPSRPNPAQIAYSSNVSQTQHGVRVNTNHFKPLVKQSVPPSFHDEDRSRPSWETSHSQFSNPQIPSRPFDHPWPVGPLEPSAPPTLGHAIGSRQETGGFGVIGPPKQQQQQYGAQQRQNESRLIGDGYNNKFDPWLNTGPIGGSNGTSAIHQEPNWGGYSTQSNNWGQPPSQQPNTRWNQPQNPQATQQQQQQQAYGHQQYYGSGAGDGLHPNMRGTMMDQYPMFTDKVQTRPPTAYYQDSKSPSFHQRNTWNN